MRPGAGHDRPPAGVPGSKIGVASAATRLRRIPPQDCARGYGQLPFRWRCRAPAFNGPPAAAEAAAKSRRCRRAPLPRQRSPKTVARSGASGFILGMAAASEVLPRAAAPLSTSRNSVSLRALSSSATPAHRRGDAIVLEHRLEVFTGVLAATVAMKDQSRLPAGTALEHAMRSASITMPHVMSACSDQPTTCRLHRSIATARYSQLSSWECR